MAFKESGEPSKDLLSEDRTGLPLEWKNLLNENCPSCGEPLTPFLHINIYKCKCGFRIGAKRMEEIAKSIEDEGEQESYNGFGFSGYMEDTPF